MFSSVSKRLWMHVRTLTVIFIDAVLLGLSTRKKGKICLIVKLDGIGDFVLWHSTLYCVLERYRGYEFVLVANSLWADMAEKLDCFDRVIAIDIERLTSIGSYRLLRLKAIRGLGASVAIQPTYSRVFLQGDSVIRASGAGDRIGFNCDLSNITRLQRAIANRWYTELVPSNDSRMMELNRNLELCKYLGSKSRSLQIRTLPEMTSLEHEKRIYGRYCVVAPGAGHVGRKWPWDSFSELISELTLRYGIQIVICGHARERAEVDQMILHSGVSTIIDLVGKDDLCEFVEIIRNASLLVGNDSASVHIAAAVGTPSVCVLGGGHFSRFFPYPDSVSGVKPHIVYEYMDCFECDWNCKKPFRSGDAFPCIKAIGVERVLKAADKALFDVLDS
jgi:ADP-heptose:LPS heptosyltransferase